jgi:hypothetical protein
MTAPFRSWALIPIARNFETLTQTLRGAEIRKDLFRCQVVAPFVSWRLCVNEI